MCYQPGEVRKIEDFRVFAITGFSSVFAYVSSQIAAGHAPHDSGCMTVMHSVTFRSCSAAISFFPSTLRCSHCGGSCSLTGAGPKQVWLLFILVVQSPNMVTPMEGGLTFFFFPILVVVAWMADAGYFGGGVESAASVVGVRAKRAPNPGLKLHATKQRAHGDQHVRLHLPQFSEDTTGDGNVDTNIAFSKAEAAALLEGVNTEGKTEDELLQIAYMKYKEKNVKTTRAEHRKNGVAMMAGTTAAASNSMARHLLHDVLHVNITAQLGFESTAYRVKESVKYLEVPPSLLQ